MQLEFGFLLGPPDGRYLIRQAPDAEPEFVVVLRTLGAPQQRLLDRRRRPRRAPAEGDPAAVPTARAGVVRAQPIGSEEEAERWLRGMRADRALLDREVARGVRELNRVMHAHRAAAADAYAPDVSAARALVARVGHGTGQQVADGRFTAAYEAPRGPKRPRRRERLSPQERLAAILSGRDRLLASDELVLRARADLDAGRRREAALQSRIALECVLEELRGDEQGRLRPELERDREAVSAAAGAALNDDPSDELIASVEEAVGRMETAIRRHRAGPA